MGQNLDKLLDTNLDGILIFDNLDVILERFKETYQEAISLC